MTSARLAAVVGLVLLAPAVAGAQQSVGDVLTFLMTNQSITTGSPAQDQQAAVAASETIRRALLANIATLPITSSSSGFVYRLNPDLGTEERATESFGPFFVERALTAGRGEMSLGLSFQHMHFTALDGQNLRDGTLVTTANQFRDEPAPFDVDRLTLGLDATIATFYGNVGVTNRLELGFAVPLVSLHLEGSRVDTYRGSAYTQATATASAVGLADVLVRTKFTVYEDEGNAIAAAAEVRLPTGKESDLLGTGTTSVRLLGIGSMERGPFGAHVNLGYSFGGLAREISYGGAVTLVAGGRVTLSGELIGRWVDTPGGIAPVATPNPTLVGVDTIRLLPAGSSLNMVSALPGLKWNITDTWVVISNVMLPLTSDGLTSPLTPFIGIDYTFGR